MTERKLGSLVGDIELKVELLGSKLEEFEYLIGKKVDDCLEKVELKE